jgi:hypothetical protein
MKMTKTKSSAPTEHSNAHCPSTHVGISIIKGTYLQSYALCIQLQRAGRAAILLLSKAAAKVVQLIVTFRRCKRQIMASGPWFRVVRLWAEGDRFGVERMC